MRLISHFIILALLNAKFIQLPYLKGKISWFNVLPSFHFYIKKIIKWERKIMEKSIILVVFGSANSEDEN